MIYKFPIYLDDGQQFLSAPTNSISFSKVSGKDGRDLRVTNLVGYSCFYNDFLKQCPKCMEIKPSEAFGLRKTLWRDQSNCIACRSSY